MYAVYVSGYFPWRPKFRRDPAAQEADWVSLCLFTQSSRQLGSKIIASCSIIKAMSAYESVFDLDFGEMSQSSHFTRLRYYELHNSKFRYLNDNIALHAYHVFVSCALLSVSGVGPEVFACQGENYAQFPSDYLMPLDSVLAFIPKRRVEVGQSVEQR